MNTVPQSQEVQGAAVGPGALLAEGWVVARIDLRNSFPEHPSCCDVTMCSESAEGWGQGHFEGKEGTLEPVIILLR